MPKSYLGPPGKLFRLLGWRPNFLAGTGLILLDNAAPCSMSYWHLREGVLDEGIPEGQLRGFAFLPADSHIEAGTYELMLITFDRGLMSGKARIFELVSDRTIQTEGEWLLCEANTADSLLAATIQHSH